MKTLIALAVCLSLLLCGCAGPAPVETAAPTTQVPETTQAPTTEATTVPTTEPPPVYTNPLNGEILEEPFTGRLFASTISNVEAALPHVGVMEADVYMEMLVNGSIIRGLALFTDVTKAETIGSVRSTRPMFNDLAEHYDLILTHAGGSGQAIRDANSRGLDHFNVDTWKKEIEEGAFSYRDTGRNKSNGWEHCLMSLGSGLVSHAQELGMATTREEGRDYGFLFTEDGTPGEGETADTISLTFTYRGTRKETVMVYDAEAGKYIYNQYGRPMADGVTGELEAFRNVAVLFANVTYDGIYHHADLTAGGTGCFACGGKLIPLTWTCDGDDQPIRFFREDGTPLYFGQGNSYIAIAPVDSPIVWAEAVEETVPAETE